MEPPSKVLLFALCAMISLQSLMIANCVPPQENGDTLVQEIASQTARKPDSKSVPDLFALLKRDPREDVLIHEAYRDICSELIAQTRQYDDDLENHLSIAHTMLRRVNQYGTKKDSHLKKALQCFSSLSQLKESDKQCSPEAQLIIDLNEHYAYLNTIDENISIHDPMYRIKLMIFQAKEEHAVACIPFFAGKYKDIVESKISDGTRDAINNGWLKHFDCEFLPAEIEDDMDSLLASEWLYKNTENALDRLLRDIAGVLWSKVLEKKSGSLNENFGELVLNPCEEYIDSLKEVFVPATKYVATNLKEWKDDYDKSILLLLEATCRYNLCQITLKYSEKVKKILSSYK